MTAWNREASSRGGQSSAAAKRREKERGRAFAAGWRALGEDHHQARWLDYVRAHMAALQRAGGAER